jgi:hypothetical protein
MITKTKSFRNRLGILAPNAIIPSEITKNNVGKYEFLTATTIFSAGNGCINLSQIQTPETNSMVDNKNIHGTRFCLFQNSGSASAPIAASVARAKLTNMIIREAELVDSTGICNAYMESFRNVGVANRRHRSAVPPINHTFLSCRLKTNVKYARTRGATPAKLAHSA